MSGSIRACQACGSHDLELLFDMGMHPLPEGARAGQRYPLRLVRCDDCSLVQLDYIVDPAEVFAKDHPYATGNSAALRRHYEDLTRSIAGTLHAGDVVVDIGANDGTLLAGYPDNLSRVAVEPTDQIRKVGYPAVLYQEFFSETVAQEIRDKWGPVKAVTAMNVLAHVPDPHDFLDGVTTLLDDDGVFVTENHDLHSVTSGLQIDTIYHEHLRYYSVASLTRLLEAHGMHVVSSVPVPTHGGSFRVTAHKARQDFPARARTAATALRGLLWQITQQKKQAVYGIGAATRATPLIHYAGIRDFITCICEVPGSDKLGQVMPGTAIPVVDEAVLITDQPPYALLLSWHMKDIIIPKLRAAGYRGKFIVPLPHPEVLEG